MTPKEKAWHLYIGYKNVLTFSISDPQMLKQASIECALKSVDEILVDVPISMQPLFENAPKLQARFYLMHYKDVKKELETLQKNN